MYESLGAGALLCQGELTAHTQRRRQLKQRKFVCGIKIIVKIDNKFHLILQKLNMKNTRTFTMKIIIIILKVKNFFFIIHKDFSYCIVSLLILAFLARVYKTKFR